MLTFTRSLAATGVRGHDGALPLFQPFGAPDDHVRLTVLLAEQFRDADPDAAQTCTSVTASWGDRRSALRSLLASAADACKSRFVGAFFDVDALDPGTAHVRAMDVWDDVQCLRERSEFLNLILDQIASDAWCIMRPEASSRAFDEVGPAPDQFSATDPATGLSSDASRLAHWLVTTTALSRPELERLLDSAEQGDRPRHLAATVYDLLPPRCRAVAKHLSCLRPPQDSNGHVGPFRVLESAPADHKQIPSQVLALLVDAGFLVRQGLALRMPRFVRAFVQSQASCADPGEVASDHLWISRELRQSSTASTAATLAEAHYHAILATDIDGALGTASHYVTDLRVLGANLSQQRRYGEAAEVFDYIAQKDPEDAYAWEYLAYNLARLDDDAHSTVIQRAYETAARLEPTNPLYQGRRLGFAGELGHDIEDEFGRLIDRYGSVDSLFASDAVRYFADCALRGLARGGKEEARRSLVRRFLSRLVRAGVDPVLLRL